MRDRSPRMRVSHALRISLLVMLVSMLVSLALPLAAQSMLENKDSQIFFNALRDKIYCDSDWIPVLLTLTNRSPVKDGLFEVEFVSQCSDRIDTLFWRGSFSVPAGEEIQRVVGIPISWNWYRRWRDSPQFTLRATRDGDRLDVVGPSTRLEDTIWFSDHSPSDGGYELVTLEVSSSAQQQERGMDWRPFARARSSKKVRQTSNHSIGQESLPQNREALLGIDIVLLNGIDPEDLSVGQRQALRGAVDAGLLVLLRPDEKGRGLGWLPGAAIEPMVEVGEDGKELVRFPVTTSASQRLTKDCASVAQGLGKWLVLEKANGPWELPSAEGLRHPWHLGSARARLESGYPLDRMLEVIDTDQRPANPMKLILFLGILYVCVLWPVIGTILKNRGKLPHMLWLQPIVGASCIVLIFVLSTFRLGVLPRHDTEVLVVRFPGETHAVVYLIDTHYAPIGGRAQVEAMGALPPLPLGVGARTQNHTLSMAADGTTQIFSDRKIRTVSHHVRCDVIEVAPSLRQVNMNDGIFDADARKVFRQLIASDPGTKASLISYGLNADQSRNRMARGDDALIECRGLERTTTGLFLDDPTRERLGLEEDVKLTVFDAALTVAGGDNR
ncbi:MAG: hypothetical protein VX404_01885 [Planctomycetota bacterium]|nr:hypothetical protein [Planctomycetota bacterium]